MGIEIVNDGPLITRTNYWGSLDELIGDFYCSVYAGVIRLLIPQSKLASVGIMRASRYVILSRGISENGRDAIQLNFDCPSKGTCILHIPGNRIDYMPAEPEPGRGWIVSGWVFRDGAPCKAFQLPCKWRRSEKLPDNSPWREPGSAEQTSRSPVSMASTASSPSSSDLPDNIIGLPRMLSNNDGELLLQILDLMDPNWREAFVANPIVQSWASGQGIDNLEATPKQICSFYADARNRHSMLLGHLLSTLARPNRVDVALCLEWEIFRKYFPSAARETSKALLNWRVARFDMDAAIVRSKTAIDKLKAISSEVTGLFKSWQKLDAERREAAILGLFAQVAFHLTDAPIKAVEEIFPEIKEEFAELQVITKKAEPELDLPTPAYLERLDERCRKQIETTYKWLGILISGEPGEVITGLLERQVEELTEIVRTREKVRSALNALAQ